MWEKIGKNIFVMALIMGIQRGNIVWPLGWASSPSLTVWLVSADKDGGMGVGGALIDPFFSPQSFLHSPT